MNQSESIAALAAALSVVQGKLKPAAFNATNPFLKNRYADLGAITEAARDLLAANGLAYVQTPTTLFSDNTVFVGLSTTLMHKSGEWLTDTIYLPLTEERGKSVAQAAGSILTYLRRYALAAMLGIVADEDNDGNAPPTKPAPRQQAEKPAAANGQATRTVAEAIADAGWPERDALARLNSEWPAKPEGKTLKLATPLKPETAAAATAWLESQLAPVE